MRIRTDLTPVLGLLGGLLLCVPLAAAAEAATRARPGKLRVYIGTYTENNKSQGIYLLDLDLATGALSAPRPVGKAVNPSFLALHPSGRFLYAVDEVADFQGKKTGAVSAFAVEQKTGQLTRLNQESSKGPGPCHLVVDRAGRHVLAANYAGGSAVVLPIQDDGKLAPASGFVQHKGSSVNKERQEAPHAHSINLDRANRFAVVADLGLDKLMVYPYDAAAGTFNSSTPLAAEVAPGSGPRHFAFHPDGRHAYVINELACTVTAFDYDAGRGTLKEVQTISALPGKRENNYSTAEVQVHPSGKFLYGSVRGHNSIVVYTIDASTGRLKYVENQPTRGKTPRNFGIDPTGAYLLAANQDSDDIIVFRIDAETGRLRPTDHRVEVPAPVCVRFVPPAR
jgi:6-phosphogluconolactonase